jgi:hypothetical protein
MKTALSTLVLLTAVVLGTSSSISSQVRRDGPVPLPPCLPNCSSATK